MGFPLGSVPGGGVPENKEVRKFLEKNPLAKIVILMDTHSLDDGLLVCGERRGNTYSGTLGQVCAHGSS